MVLLRLLAWPLCAGLGFAFVVWFYELMGSSRTLREIDEILLISVSGWFLGPALTWFLIPGSWQTRSWIVWTLAGGGTAIFASLFVLVGLMVYDASLQTTSAMSLDRVLDAIASLAENSIERAFWLPGPAAAYLVPMCLGYFLPMGLIAWRLAAIFLLASAVGVVVAYFSHGAAVEFLMATSERTGSAHFASLSGLAFILSTIVGTFGALGIAIGSLISPPIQEEASW